MRFCPSLFDEKSTQIQVTLFVGETIEADQSQLYFWMSAISGQLIRSGAKYCGEMIRQTNGNIEQSLFTGCLTVDHCGFNQVTRAIELVEVAKVFETVTWAPGEDVAIQVTVC